ncbi:cyclophilin-like fold protein [Carnobacterium maltaromaticum]|uniref:Cyclophilin-like fold protein n=3 Tax=Lactobacillales TaxID=186826 RepID=A0AAW9K181_CARML|nr:cyclophilin-like fold protein [Carnobacterium maltaromaticum]
MISSSCAANLSKKDTALSKSKIEERISEKHTMEETGEGKVMNITIEGKLFQIELAFNQATKELRTKLPLTLRMNDLHDNEKYVYLSEVLPTQVERVDEIEKGDVMLFGSDCLVLFYQTFSTNYLYTKIGKIKEVDQLDFIAKLETIDVTLIH